MLSWFRPKPARAADQSDDTQPIYHWSADEIPRYPPFMKGLPVVPPENLLETQCELIERITNTAIATPKIIDCYYLPAVRRFAAYAHLLPASQSHHHRGAGGLLRHSIEVGLWALQSADKVLLESAKSPSQRREMEPRWQLAVFLASLCHDAGKPVTDMVVTNKDRTAIWKPIKEDLFTWASKNHVRAYFLDWREGRARQHTALSNLIGDRIIGAETLDWIEEGGTDLIVWLMESLTSHPGPTNPIYDLVIKADQASVERDLKTLGVAMAGYDLGVPVERHLTDIMRRFIKEGLWLVNEPGARIWNIAGNVYLIWPAAGEEIAKQVREDGIPGIPRTPDGILDMLLERQIAFVREDAAPGELFWKIAPAVLVEKIPDIKLPAIRLRDEAMLSTIPIAPVIGRIINETSQKGYTDLVQTNSPDVPLEGAMSTEKPDAVVATFPDNKSQITQREEDSKRPPSIKDDQKPSLPSAASSASEHDARPSIASTGTGQKQIPALNGAVGEALKALAQDLKSGDKRWGSEVVLDKDHQLLMRWPESFSGYGLTVKMILDELVAKEWLWIDPMTPLKRVLDAEMNGESIKAIRLARALTPVFLSEAGGGPRMDMTAAGLTVVPTVSSSYCINETTVERNDGQQGKSPSAKKETPKIRSRGITNGPTASIPPATDALSLAQVIQVLTEISTDVIPDQTGWVTVAKYKAMSQFKAKDLKFPLSHLNYLSKNHPDRLVVAGSKIQYRA
jgi:conjugal transfer pilus assembly protein TraI